MALACVQIAPNPLRIDRSGRRAGLARGQSDKPCLFIEQSDQVEVLRDLIASLGPRPVFIGGISFGGVIALRYAIEHPATIAGLVPMSSFAEMPPQLMRLGTALHTALILGGTTYLQDLTDSVHYLELDEVNGLKLLQRQQQANRTKGAYLFINERGQPFGRMGIGRMVERAGEAARLPFPVHVHMLRHSTGYALAGRGMDTRQLQHFLGHASITNTVRYTAMSPEPFKDIWR